VKPTPADGVRSITLAVQPTLETGAADRPAASEKSNRAKSSRRRRVADAVEKVLKSHGLDRERGHRSCKEIATLIGPEMPNPPRSELQVNALSKAVERYYRRRENPGK
jgi:hypothetical protein